VPIANAIPAGCGRERKEKKGEKEEKKDARSSSGIPLSKIDRGQPAVPEENRSSGRKKREGPETSVERLDPLRKNAAAEEGKEKEKPQIK